MRALAALLAGSAVFLSPGPPERIVQASTWLSLPVGLTADCRCQAKASLSDNCSTCQVTFTVTDLIHAPCSPQPSCQPINQDVECHAKGTISFTNCSPGGSRPVTMYVGCPGVNSIIYACPSGTGIATVNLTCAACAPI